MRSSVILTSILVSSALGLVTPQTANTNIANLFDVPGASEELGFSIPDNIPDGVYSAYIDSDGTAHFARLEGPEDLESLGKDDGEETTSPALYKRQSEWQVHCQRDPLERRAADVTVDWLINYFRNGPQIYRGQHVFAMANRVVSFVCNMSRTTGYHVTSYHVESQIRDRISTDCGRWRSGWSNYRVDQLSIGYHNLDSNNHFCGRNHERP